MPQPRRLPQILLLLLAGLAGAGGCARSGLNYEEARELAIAMVRPASYEPIYWDGVPAHYGNIPLYYYEPQSIDSCATGIAGLPGRYYRHVHELAQLADVSIFRQMTTDSDPRVRVTGLICLAIRKQNVPILHGDYQEIASTEGCFGKVYTLEAFSMGLQPDGELRGHYAN